MYRSTYDWRVNENHEFERVQLKCDAEGRAIEAEITRWMRTYTVAGPGDDVKDVAPGVYAMLTIQLRRDGARLRKVGGLMVFSSIEEREARVAALLQRYR
jgi:hypothetical protein